MKNFLAIFQTNIFEVYYNKYISSLKRFAKNIAKPDKFIIMGKAFKVQTYRRKIENI
jgi:hypothetical protein